MVCAIISLTYFCRLTFFRRRQFAVSTLKFLVLSLDPNGNPHILKNRLYHQYTTAQLQRFFLLTLFYIFIRFWIEQYQMTVRYRVNSNRQILHVKHLEDSRKHVSLKTLLSANGKYYKYAYFVIFFFLLFTKTI